MTTPRKTSNDKLVSAMRILAGEIESPDGVANIAIGEGADRIEELAAANSMAKTWEESFAKTVPALRARVAELEEKAERYRLTTLRQDARVAELDAALREMVDAQDATVEQFTATEIDRLEKAMRSSREILARAKPADLVQEACGGRCGDPLCNLSTEGELMREPANHPDSDAARQGAAS